MKAALTRYRVMAYVVGVMLLVLTLIAMPLKYIAGEPMLVQTVGPMHGFLFMVYLIVTFDLAMRSRWSLGWTGLVMLAGTVPFLSFVAERAVTKQANRQAEQASVSRS